MDDKLTDFTKKFKKEVILTELDKREERTIWSISDCVFGYLPLGSD